MKWMSFGSMPQLRSWSSMRLPADMRTIGNASINPCSWVSMASGEMPASNSTLPWGCLTTTPLIGISTQRLGGFFSLKVSAQPAAPGRNQPTSPPSQP